MASILFTALALIAAGQAGPVPTAAGDGMTRSSPSAPASAVAPNGGRSAARSTPRRRG